MKKKTRKALKIIGIAIGIILLCQYVLFTYFEYRFLEVYGLGYRFLSQDYKLAATICCKWRKDNPDALAAEEDGVVTVWYDSHNQKLADWEGKNEIALYPLAHDSFERIQKELDSYFAGEGHGAINISAEGIEFETFDTDTWHTNYGRLVLVFPDNMEKPKTEYSDFKTKFAYTSYGGSTACYFGRNVSIVPWRMAWPWGVLAFSVWNRLK